MLPITPWSWRSIATLRLSSLANTTPEVRRIPRLRHTRSCVALMARLLGGGLWMPPTKRAAQSVSSDWRNVLALSRLCVANGEPQNATGILLARSMRMLPKRWHTLVTYADSRMGHTGVIYRATNWLDLGDTKGDPVWVTKDGRQVAKKCAGHSRTSAEMLALGLVRLPASKKRKFVFFRRAARAA